MPDPIDPDQPTPITARMTGSAGVWQPPSVEEAAQLFPQYEIIALIGRGGMGAVYQARQLALDRFVAIKLLPLEVSADQNFADRFVREARTMGKLSHPNIIAVYDFGQTPAGHWYFAMEFVEGTNLHQVIHGPGLEPAQVLSIIGEVCDALAYAHGKGVVHRDIKPANVMLNTEGHVKVADFGLARLTDPSAEQLGHTQTGFVMGTPDYMAPEQKRGMNVDHRADIYSLGVMLYEMLCKETPQGIFDPPSHRVPVDARVDQVVVKAMQQTPERRFQSSTEMKSAVDIIRTMPAPKPRGGAASQAHRSPAEQPEQPRGNPRALLYAGIAVAAAAVIGVLIFANRPKPKRSAARVTPLVLATPAPTPVAATPAPAALMPIAATTPAPATPMPTPMQAAAATPVAMPPAPAATPPPPVLPEWLRIAREKGGRLRATGTVPGGGALDLGKAGEFDDFITLTASKHGWAARRRGGETYASAWKGAKPVLFGPFETSFLSHSEHIVMRMAKDGAYRNIWSGQSQLRPDMRHAESVSLLGMADYLIALGGGGELLLAKSWGGGGPTPPADFFLGATAFTATENQVVSARPGQPVRSWEKSGKVTDFAEPTEEVIEMDGATGGVIILTRSGKVFVTDGSGGKVTQAVGTVPADVEPAVRVRMGNKIAAAQKADASWRVWGDVTPELAQQVSALKSVVDLDVQTSNDGAYALWIDAEAATPIVTTPSPTAAPEVVKWLAEQDAAFAAQWKAVAQVPFESAVAKLRAQYDAGVENGIAAATKAAKLEDAIAWRNEKARLGAQQPHEAEDAATDPEALKQLRAWWRAQFARVDAERFAKARAVHQRFDSLLATGQTGYTQKQRLDDALLLKTKREEIAKAWLTPPLDLSKAAAPKPAMGEKLAPPKPVNVGTGTLAGREAVEWFLEMNGHVAFEDASGVQQSISAPNDPAFTVPKGKLEVVSVMFDRNKRDGSPITDQDFEKVAPLRKLTSIVLTAPQVSGSGLSFLAGCSELTSVSLNLPSFTDAALVPLLGLRKLTQLGVSTGTQPPAWTRFAELASLPMLGSFSATGVENLPAAAFGRMKRVRSLNVSATRLSDEQFAAIAAIPDLDNLTITGLDGTGAASMRHLAGARKVVTLNITSCPGIEPHLGVIGKMRSLSVLYVDGQHATGLAAAAGAPALRTIYLAGNAGTTGATDAGLKVIADSFPKLEALAFMDAAERSVTADGLRTLAKMPRLKAFTWGKKQMPSDLAAAIASLPALEKLTVADCGIEDGQLIELAKSRTLTGLDLSHQKLHPATLEALKAMRGLRELIVYNCGLMPDDTAALRKALPKCVVKDG